MKPYSAEARQKFGAISSNVSLSASLILGTDCVLTVRTNRCWCQPHSFTSRCHPNNHRGAWWWLSRQRVGLRREGGNELAGASPPGLLVLPVLDSLCGFGRLAKR